jgi:hypothetical protein
MSDEDIPKRYKSTFLRPPASGIKNSPSPADRPKKFSSSRKRDLNFLQKLMTRLAFCTLAKQASEKITFHVMNVHFIYLLN